jgi:hypothetical protein
MHKFNPTAPDASNAKASHIVSCKIVVKLFAVVNTKADVLSEPLVREREIAFRCFAVTDSSCLS